MLICVGCELCGPRVICINREELSPQHWLENSGFEECDSILFPVVYFQIAAFHIKAA